MLAFVAVSRVYLSLLLVACVATPPPGGREAATRSDLICRHTFGADGVLLGPAEDAAARWSAATGCDISVTVGVGDTTLALALSIPKGPGGREVPGWTSDDLTQILVHARAGESQHYRTIAHEEGHALGGLHTETDGVLSGWPERRDVIDAAALATVCARLPCLWQEPEDGPPPE